jgi:uncharacterized protein YprB with RNaseH-like and TPR domain
MHAATGYSSLMLAFDIETQGLLSDVDDITVASVYDPERGIKKTFFFMREGYNRQENIDSFLEVLDNAPVLCCFNGVRFDIPFIIARFHVAPERYTKWFMKVQKILRDTCKELIISWK